MGKVIDDNANVLRYMSGAVNVLAGSAVTCEGSTLDLAKCKIGITNERVIEALANSIAVSAIGKSVQSEGKDTLVGDSGNGDAELLDAASGRGNQVGSDGEAGTGSPASDGGDQPSGNGEAQSATGSGSATPEAQIAKQERALQ